jgi:DNA mismatch repair protein MutS2
MKFFPEHSPTQLEFGIVKDRLALYCKSAYSKQKAQELRIHTRIEFIEPQLKQSFEYLQLLQNGISFPNDFTLPIEKIFKLLSIPGATLLEEDFNALRKLCENTERIFRWFDAERRQYYPALSLVIDNNYYEKVIKELINDVIDDAAQVKDNASEALFKIRASLYKKRNEQRRLFAKVIQRLQKNGYLTDTGESFMNGRRVVAVFAEYKRQVGGVMHGESDSGKTSFLEPEETIAINNELFSLENEERNEVIRVLRQLTATLNPYANLLNSYNSIAGEYDFIKAKAMLARDMDAKYPTLEDKPMVNLENAYHPLLYIYHKTQGKEKEVIPLNLKLDENNHIVVISGPNAGGKTVTMKTVGLLQLMVQSGLLVTTNPESRMGIFKQLFMDMGDTQSIEFELSTYSGHLRNMKYFIETANGKTLFLIDELGGGSDPTLGGAFAEVTIEALAKRRAFGIITTHYLNLKIMANKTKGIVNAAMAFDEKKLQPLYQLIVGKPGSSYTFAIAERIGMPKELITKARQLVDEDSFLLDKLLNKTEQELHQLRSKDSKLQVLVKENEQLKKQLEQDLNKEKHRQQVNILREQNRIKQEDLDQLRELDRKIKQLIQDWRKSTDKAEVMKQAELLFSKQKQKQVTEKFVKKINEKYKEVKAEILLGSTVKLKKNHQVGTVQEIKGKNAVVKIGLMPITVALTDLVAVAEQPNLVSKK